MPTSRPRCDLRTLDGRFVALVDVVLVRIGETWGGRVVNRDEVALLPRPPGDRLVIRMTSDGEDVDAVVEAGPLWANGQIIGCGPPPFG